MPTRSGLPGDDEQQEQNAAPGDGPRPVKEPAASPRDYLANERTLLAWIRTGVALIGLGFVVARFGLFLRELGLRGGAGVGQTFPGGGWSSLIGVIIILLAALSLALSYLRYRGTARALDRGAYAHSQGLSIGMVAIIILIALGLAVYLLLTS